MKKPGKSEAAFRVVAKRYPGLVEKIKRLVEESERAFAGNAPETEGSYLWEHTVHVASLAFKLAEEERRDPLLAAITALFHDAGKFAGGSYHAGGTTEEDEAAKLAGPVLKRSRVPAADRYAILAALGSLYKEGASPNPTAAIVHDADFLSKFGALGVAQFFIKSALRGKTLHATVMNSLSKELTYAACLPLNMRTKAGRARAEAKAEETIRFYETLLKELGETHGGAFRIKTVSVPHPSRRGRKIEARLVLSAACEDCGGGWTVARTIKAGVKCTRLEARLRCRSCGASHEIGFCLPEL
ncbi:MAG: HD domain-containing protein [Acidobacteriota bacterium]|nr:HD domain-containing protein [Acidobacteriota bacterium]